VKMFGPALSGPARLVNRDVPVCDEQAYVRAGYKRGSLSETPEIPEPPKPSVNSLSLGSEELPMEDPDPGVEAQPVVEKPTKIRKKKGQD
jgi:hypothetical protein